MTGYDYTAIFEIADQSRPPAALYAEACRGLDAMAAADGARITGDPTYWIAGDNLIVKAPAIPLDGFDPRQHVDEIVVERACRGERVDLTSAEMLAAISLLAQRGKTASQISRLLRMSGTTAARRLEAVA